MFATIGVKTPVFLPIVVRRVVFIEAYKISIQYSWIAMTLLTLHGCFGAKAAGKEALNYMKR